MNKRAQFFLIAALIIAMVILALGQVYTKSTITQYQEVVYDLSNEVYYETSQVIDNGILHERPHEKIVADIKNLTSYYARLNPDSDIVLLYGDDTQVTEIAYDGAQRALKSNPVLTNRNSGESDEKKVKIDIIPINTKEADNSKGKLERITREFTIKKGQNFYVVIRKKIHNEQFVVTR